MDALTTWTNELGARIARLAFAFRAQMLASGRPPY